MPEEVPTTPPQTPGILAIQKKLNYLGHTRQDRWQEFYDDIRKFLRAYIPRAGTLRRKFDNWRSLIDLNAITNDYLDKDKNGHRYWPEEAESPYFDAHLQYSFDRSTSVLLLLIKMRL